LKKLAESEKERLYELQAILRYNHLPCLDLVTELLGTFKQIPDNGSDDCVKYLAEDGKELKQTLDKIVKIEKVIKGDNLNVLLDTNELLNKPSSVVTANVSPEDPVIKDIDDLKECLESEDFFDRVTSIKSLYKNIFSKYSELYSLVHAKRNADYRDLLLRLQSDPEWASLPPDFQAELQKPVIEKSCDDLAMDNIRYCTSCKSTYENIDSDILSLAGIEKNVFKKFQEFISKSSETVEIVHLNDYFNKSVTDFNDFKEQLDKFMAHIDELLKEGKKVILE